MATDRRLLDSRLPTYLTRFIGREPEVAFVRHLLGGGNPMTAERMVAVTPQPRLVTLSGMGGSGKTRLAVEVARSFALVRGDGPPRFPDGVRWVELAPVTDGAQLPHTVAAALNLHEAASANPMAGLVNALKDRQTLVVLDNCEHLAAASRHLVHVLLGPAPA